MTDEKQEPKKQSLRSLGFLLFCQGMLAGGGALVGAIATANYILKNVVCK